MPVPTCTNHPQATKYPISLKPVYQSFYKPHTAEPSVDLEAFALAVGVGQMVDENVKDVWKVDDKMSFFCREEPIAGRVSP